MTTASNTASNTSSLKRSSPEGQEQESERPKKRITIKTTSRKQQEMPERAGTPMPNTEKRKPRIKIKPTSRKQQDAPQRPGTPMPGVEQTIPARPGTPMPRMEESNAFMAARPVQKPQQPKPAEDIYSPEVSPMVAPRKLPRPANPAPQRADWKQPLQETKDRYGWSISNVNLKPNPKRKNDEAFRGYAEYLRQELWKEQNKSPPNFRATMYYLQELKKLADKYATKAEAAELGAMARKAKEQRKEAGKQERKKREPAMMDYTARMANLRGSPGGRAEKKREEEKERRAKVAEIIKEQTGERRENGTHEFEKGFRKWRTVDDEEWKAKQRKEKVKEREDKERVGIMVDWACRMEDMEKWAEKLHGMSQEMQKRVWEGLDKVKRGLQENLERTKAEEDGEDEDMEEVDGEDEDEGEGRE